MPPPEYSLRSSSSSSSSDYYPSDAKSSIQEKAYKRGSSSSESYPSDARSSTQDKAYKPSSSATNSSSYRPSLDSKVVIHYSSTYKDPDRRSKNEDSDYYR